MQTGTYMVRPKKLTTVKQQQNFQHPPPESFQESINGTCIQVKIDSSVCNVDDSRKEQSAIEKKQITLEGYKQNQVYVVLEKQREKEKIFGAKLKTTTDEQHSKKNFIHNIFQKDVLSSKLNPPPRKLSEIESLTDREPSRKSSQQVSKKTEIHKINQINQTNTNTKKMHTQPQVYSQLVAQIYQTEQFNYKSPKEQSKCYQSQNSSNQRINVALTTVTTTPANESAQKQTPKSIPISPNSSISQKQKFFISDEKNENFGQNLKDRVSSISSNGHKLEQTDQFEQNQIGQILSENMVIFKEIKKSTNTNITKSETNVIRPMLAFKKHHSMITQKQVIDAMLQNDIPKFRQLMNDSRQQYLNINDALGNTILILSIKLYGLHKKYDELLKEVLKFNPDPFLKNTVTGWSAMDESLSQRSVYATALLFQQCYKVRRLQFDQQYTQLMNVLIKIPNFQLEMNWNFDSPLPFVKMLAPNDTVKLWKFNQDLRLDSTLVGFSKLQCKRRNMSLLFTQGKLCQINRTNDFYTDPLEELDFEEKKLIIHDILNCEPVNGAIEITDCQVKEVTDWRGRPICEKVGNYLTERFDLKITYKSSTLKKNNDTQIKFAVERELYEEWLHQEVIPNTELIVNKKAKELTESKTVSLWICRNHQLGFRDFNNIISFLGKGNHMIDKLAKVFERPEIQKIVAINGFPVKVQIPFQFSVHATISFINFNSLLNAEQLFKIPLCKYMKRKQAQKIVEQKRKRLLLANLYL